MRYKLSSPRDPSSDRFVLSKGHAAPILYAGETCNLNFLINVLRHSILNQKGIMVIVMWTSL